MRKQFYPAVLERAANGYFGLWFPDFPGAVAAGPTQADAMAKGQEVLTAAMQRHGEQDGALPAPSPVEAIELPDGCDFVAYLVVGATPPDPAERVNVYLSRSLIERVDETAAAWGMTRSSFFGLAVSRLLSSFSANPGLAAGRKWRPGR
jgi:predicted RNase H-like HicB family nuclease